MVVGTLTDDTLDVIMDIVMTTSRRLYGRLLVARQHWLDVTRDYFHEWCDRRSLDQWSESESDATIKA